MTQSAGAILRRAARRHIANGLSFKIRASDAKYFDLFFSAELRSFQYLLLHWCSRDQDTLCNSASASHYQVQLSVPIFHSRLYTLRLPLYLKMGAQPFDVRCRISHPVFSVFRNYCQRLKYIVLLLQFEIFSALTSQAIASSRLLLACIGPKNFSAEVPTYYQEPWYSRITQSLISSALTQPSSRDCNVAFKKFFGSEQHSCCLFQAILPTQSHQHFVILTPRHWVMPQEAEGPTR